MVHTFWLKIWGDQKLHLADGAHFFKFNLVAKSYIWADGAHFLASWNFSLCPKVTSRMVHTFWRFWNLNLSGQKLHSADGAHFLASWNFWNYSHTCTWESILTNASHRRRACTTCSYRSAAPLGHGAALRRSVPKCDFENLKKCARVGKCNFKVTFGGNLVKRASRDKPCTLLVQR